MVHNNRKKFSFSLKRKSKVSSNPAKFTRVVSSNVLPCNKASTSSSLSSFTSVFLKEEAWAVKDAKKLMLVLPEGAANNINVDYLIRTIRSSSFLALPERRLKRNLSMIKKRIKWQEKYNVPELPKLCGLTQNSSLTQIKIDSNRIEQFRNLVLPLKIFGYSKNDVPIVKWCFSECNWKLASTVFKDKKELKTLICLTLETLKNKLRAACCRAETSRNEVFVTGKFILICNASALNMRNIRNGYGLQLSKFVSYITNFYPDMVLKTYVVHAKHSVRGSRVLYPFVATRIIRRISFFSSDVDVVEALVKYDRFDLSQCPVEFGGSFEGRYVVDVTMD